ncbi:MAG: hypothetical protein IH944_12895 [Armatimonadetes bacterium]|nr:hypothetical protein [Armatimonadota bacterium]
MLFLLRCAFWPPKIATCFLDLASCGGFILTAVDMKTSEPVLTLSKK